jgi:hypothetical protein
MGKRLSIIDGTIHQLETELSALESSDEPDHPGIYEISENGLTLIEEIEQRTAIEILSIFAGCRIKDIHAFMYDTRLITPAMALKAMEQFAELCHHQEEWTNEKPKSVGLYLRQNKGLKNPHYTLQTVFELDGNLYTMHPNNEIAKRTSIKDMPDFFWLKIPQIPLSQK